MSIALTTFIECNPFFSIHAFVHPKDNSPPSTYSCRYLATPTCATYDSFPGLIPTLTNNLMATTCYKTQKTGHKTYNVGYMTHNSAGHATRYTSYMSSIKLCHLMPGCMTSGPISISCRWGHNHGAHCCMTNKLSYQSCPCHHIIIVHKLCDLTQKTINCMEMFRQPCYKSLRISIHGVLRCTHYSGSPPDRNLKPPSHSIFLALPLVMVIDLGIYYLKGTFNQACDVNHLISRLLLQLQQYITRHNDFKHGWFMLLLSGLLRTWHGSLWILTILLSSMGTIIVGKVFRFKILASCSANWIIIYTMKLMISKTMIWSLCLCFCKCITFITGYLSVFLVSGIE